MHPKRFRKLKMLGKALLTVAGTYLAQEAGARLISGELTAMQGGWENVLLSVGFGAGRAVQNAWKNRNLPGNPFYGVSLLGFFLAAGLGTMLLSGCVSGAEALDQLDRAERIVNRVELIAGAAELYMTEQGATEEQLKVVHLVQAAAEKLLTRIAEARAVGDGLGVDAADLLQEVIDWRRASQTTLKNARAGV